MTTESSVRIGLTPEEVQELQDLKVDIEGGPMMSVADIAEVLGLNRETVRLKVAAGAIPGGRQLKMRPGKPWVVPRDEFVAWMKDDGLEDLG